MKYIFSKPYYSDFTLQCQEISINLKNDALVFQGRYQGKYQPSDATNGKPTWTSKDRAIWFDGKSWVIGSLQKIGKKDGDFFLPFHPKHFSPYDKESQWLYSNEIEWKTPKPDDIDITCTMKAGESVFVMIYYHIE